MSQIPGTVIGSSVVPSDTADTYATHQATYGLGGWRSVADTAARDAIPSDRREEGMIVYVRDIDITYYLKDGITNLDWVIFFPGLDVNRIIILNCFNSSESVTNRNSAVSIPMNTYLDGYTLKDVYASVTIPGTTGTTSVTIRRNRAGVFTQVMSSATTIVDAARYSNNGVISASDIAVGDELFIDVSTTHVVAPMGLSVSLTVGE